MTRDTDEHLRSLLVDAYGATEPSEASRRRVMTAIAHAPDHALPRRPSDRPRLVMPAWRRAVASVAASATLLLPAGAAVADTDSLPGDLAYGVRHAAEQLWVGVTWGEAEVHARQTVAARRLAEAEAIRAVSGPWDQVQALQAEARELLEDLEGQTSSREAPQGARPADVTTGGEASGGARAHVGVPPGRADDGVPPGQVDRPAAPGAARAEVAPRPSSNADGPPAHARADGSPERPAGDGGPVPEPAPPRPAAGGDGARVEGTPSQGSPSRTQGPPPHANGQPGSDADATPVAPLSERIPPAPPVAPPAHAAPAPQAPAPPVPAPAAPAPGPPAHVAPAPGPPSAVGGGGQAGPASPAAGGGPPAGPPG